MLEGRGTRDTGAEWAANGVGINWKGPGGHYLEWVLIVSTRCVLIGSWDGVMGEFIGEGWAKEMGTWRGREGKGREERERDILTEWHN